MLSRNDLFEHELRKLVKAEQVRLTENLAAGSPDDWAEYRETVGQIRALKRVEHLCNDVRTEMEKR